MEAGGGNEGGDQTNEVVVHVTRVTKSRGAGSHYGGNLEIGREGKEGGRGREGEGGRGREGGREGDTGQGEL